MSVTIYSQAGCYPCKATIRKTQELGLDHTVIDIAEDPEARAYVMGLGFQSTPVVVAGDQSWAGYSPHRLQALVA